VRNGTHQPREVLIRAVLQPRSQLLNLSSDTPPAIAATSPASFRARRISASTCPTAEPS
jgi:hypothetical protein